MGEIDQILNTILYGLLKKNHRKIILIKILFVKNLRSQKSLKIIIVIK